MILVHVCTHINVAKINVSEAGVTSSVIYNIYTSFKYHNKLRKLVEIPKTAESPLIGNMRQFFYISIINDICIKKVILNDLVK